MGTRAFSLDSVVYAYNRGEDAIEIQRAFDTLSLADIHAAIAYYLHNREKVDKFLAKRAADFEKRRAENHEKNRNIIEKVFARKNGLDPDWKK